MESGRPRPRLPNVTSMLWDKPNFEKKKKTTTEPSVPDVVKTSKLPYTIVYTTPEGKNQVITEAHSLEGLLKKGQNILHLQNDPDGIPF